MQEPVTVIPEGFALFEDGPFLQLLRRLPAIRPIVSSPAGRVLLAIAIAWLPLLVLSIHDGLALHGVAIPFLADVQTHVRMLITLPIYILAAHEAHRIITPALNGFVERDVVRVNDRERFKSILLAASGWNHSVVLRLAIVGFIVFFGQDLWRQQLASRQVRAWYGEQGLSGMTLTSAGHWFMWVTNPLFQYLHLLWIVRLLMYAVMLARIAALDLHLVATHPDHAGGVGFLGSKTHAFMGLVMGEGAAAAGVLANRVFNEGRPLTVFKMDILAAALIVAVMVLGPTCVFVPQLLKARRKGLAEYGEIANRYVREFEEAWVFGKANIEGRELLGSSDIQSLADMATAYQVVKDMRAVPFRNKVVIEVVVVFLLPIAPLLLTVIPPEKLLDQIIHGLLS